MVGSGHDNSLAKVHVRLAWVVDQAEHWLKFLACQAQRLPIPRAEPVASGSMSFPGIRQPEESSPARR